MKPVITAILAMAFSVESMASDAPAPSITFPVQILKTVQKPVFQTMTKEYAVVTPEGEVKHYTVTYTVRRCVEQLAMVDNPTITLTLGQDASAWTREYPLGDDMITVRFTANLTEDNLMLFQGQVASPTNVLDRVEATYPAIGTSIIPGGIFPAPSVALTGYQSHSSMESCPPPQLVADLRTTHRSTQPIVGE